MRKLLLSLIISALPLLCFAQNQSVFTIYPTHEHQGNKHWILASEQPGTTYGDTVTVENLTDETINLKLEFKESTGARKEFKIIESEDYQNIGKWTTLETNSVTLPPKGKKKITIRIDIPKNAETKEYQGVILASHTSSENTDINIQTRIGTRVYLNVTKSQQTQTNSFNLNISTTQIALIILAGVGIVYSLRKKNEN